MLEEEQIWSEERLGHGESSLHDSLFGSLEQSGCAVGRKKRKHRLLETGADLQDSEEREKGGEKRMLHLMPQERLLPVIKGTRSNRKP